MYEALRPALGARMRAICAAWFVLASGTVVHAQVPVFPNDVDWIPIERSGAVVGDALGDIPIDSSRDVVGDSNRPAAYIWSDATFLFLRLRLDDNPAAAAKGYGCEINTNDGNNSYQFLALIDKTFGVELWRNSSTSLPNSTGETSDTQLQSYAYPTFSLSSVASGTPFSGASDFFVSWAIRRADALIDPRVPLRLVCGTNSNGVASFGLNADLAGTASGGPQTISSLISDQYQCGDNGCVASVCPSGPEITSADNATFFTGAEGAFEVATTGCPLPFTDVFGALPDGVSYDPVTQSLRGTPSPGTEGDYPLLFTASSGGFGWSQDFTLTVLSGSIFGDSFEDLP